MNDPYRRFGCCPPLLLIDAVLMTNDQSHIPPGERFLH